MTYQAIVPGGESTGAALNLQRRLTLVDRLVGLRGKRIADLGSGQADVVPSLRAVSMRLEKTPVLRRFGVSQLLVARPATTAS